MTKKEIAMKAEIIAATGQKTCCDCLHCKVAAASDKSNRVFFCAISTNKLRYTEIYWFAIKKVCKNFNDMGGFEVRRPLLRKRA